jgi:hypothetical protein
MIHDLTIGHLDPEGIPLRRTTVLKPLELDVVRRLLEELGSTDADGRATLGGAWVGFESGYVTVPWLGGWRNRAAEEFAIRLQRETGCLVADMGHRRVIEQGELQGTISAVAGSARATGK